MWLRHPVAGMLHVRYGGGVRATPVADAPFDSAFSPSRTRSMRRFLSTRFIRSSATLVALAVGLAVAGCASMDGRSQETADPTRGDMAGDTAAADTVAAAEAEPSPSVFGDAPLVVKRRADFPNEGLALMTDDGTVMETLEDTEAAGRPSWSPDGDRLAYRIGREIRVRHRDGREETLARGHWPSWSPDGTRIAFHRDGDIYVTELETGETRCLGPTPEWEGYPAWLSDGRLAFARRQYTGEAREAYLERSPLPDSACVGEATEPAPDAGTALGVIDPGTGRTEMLAGGDDFVFHLAASPVAPELTYTADGGAIAVLHVDSTESRLAVDREEMAQYPRFGPDGHRIAFSYGYPADLWVVDRRTGEMERLTNDEVGDDMVDWR